MKTTCASKGAYVVSIMAKERSIPKISFGSEQNDKNSNVRL